jgi:hypothetical protein
VGLGHLARLESRVGGGVPDVASGTPRTCYWLCGTWTSTIALELLPEPSEHVSVTE